MRTAKVLIPALSGRGNRIYKYGETVTDANFPSGNFEKLIAGKYIEEVTSGTTKQDEQKTSGADGIEVTTFDDTGKPKKKK